MDALTSGQFAELDALFQEAAALDDTARAAFVADVRARSPVLAPHLEAMLRADAADSRVIGAIVSEGARAALGEPTHGEDRHVPDAIGPYRLQDVLGEGGMGTVFRAEQVEPLHRHVALKLIRRGLDTERIVSRFRAERQALALMDHPNIAKVLDAGASDDGRPYFVMELVEGTPITKYCRERGLPVRPILQLFLAVCQGVQHAHQKGIIHRDLKPSNVLVQDVDGVATPKIIDFGVAKAIAGSDEEAGQTTQMGLIVGTPDYMSPEQAGVMTTGVDTRTDVYSLGVLLYELLTGERPYRFSSYSPVEVQRVLSQADPVRPSTRIAGRTAGADLPRTTIERHRRELAGDLDTIVLKALEKQPANRYQSVQQFAEDVRRHLIGLPILARTPTWRYRSAKFVRRHTAIVAFAATIVVLLAGAAVVFALQAARLASERDRAVDAERRARQQAATSEAVSSFLVDIFRASDPSEAQGNTITAREILDRGVARVDSELGTTPAVQATLLLTTGRVYQSLGLFAEAQPLLERALKQRETLFGADHALVGESLDALALLKTLRGDFAGAEPLYRRALAIERRTLGPDDAATARTLNNLGSLLLQTDRLNEAEPPLREALAMRIRLFGPDHADVAETTHDLAGVLWYKGDLPGAEALFRRALALDRALHGDTHPDVAIDWNSLGQVLQREGDFTGAEDALRHSLEVTRALYGEEHPDVAHAMSGLGSFLVDRGKLDAAEPLLRKALDLHRRLLGPKNQFVVSNEYTLGLLLLKKGSLADARVLLEQAVGLADEVFGETSIWTAAGSSQLAEIARRQGRLAAAESLQRRAVDAFRAVRGADHPDYGGYLSDLGVIVKQRGRLEEAEQLQREALAVRRKAPTR